MTSLLTVAQVAELWNVNPRTVRDLYRSGQLRVVRIGRAVRIPADALDEFLEESGR